MFIESKAQTSYSIFHRIEAIQVNFQVFESPSFRDTVQPSRMGKKTCFNSIGRRLRNSLQVADLAVLFSASIQRLGKRKTYCTVKPLLPHTSENLFIRRNSSNQYPSSPPNGYGLRGVRLYYLSTELHCHSPTQHYGEPYLYDRRCHWH